ncbi:peptidoglycan bridge formation glycyltransferase FemA/FemB family protein [Clostridiaceae bacterium]|nr:peptidoglycan bridge formation glycyltransferase FemA/FemB family protein [Clostridiaceae bacterium]
MVIYRSIDELRDMQKELLSGANIFYTKEYARFEKKRGNDCIYAGNEDGILLVVIWKKLFFRYAQMPSEPYYFCGSINKEEEQIFLDQVMELLKQYAYWVDQTDPGANFRAYPTRSKRIPFGNYIIDLSLEEEELFKNLTGKCRNMIRRAMKDGVSIRKGGAELLDDYMVCDSKTWERSNIRLNLKEVYRDYLNCLGENAQIYIAWKDQTIQGGAVFIKNEAMSYYYIKH